MEKVAVAKPIRLQVFRCLFCDGHVDRYQHCFQCRDCGAEGDLETRRMARQEVRS